MTDIAEIAKSLRLVGLTEVDEAADLIEQQAARIAELESRLGAQAGEHVAYVYEHTTHPGDYTRFVAFERTAHSKDFVCRPLVYATSVDSAMAKDIRREALEEAAKICDRMVSVSAVNYETGTACAHAIRALAASEPKTGE